MQWTILEEVSASSFLYANEADLGMQSAIIFLRTSFSSPSKTSWRLLLFQSAMFMLLGFPHSSSMCKAFQGVPGNPEKNPPWTRGTCKTRTMQKEWAPWYCSTWFMIEYLAHSTRLFGVSLLMWDWTIKIWRESWQCSKKALIRLENCSSVLICCKGKMTMSS